MTEATKTKPAATTPEALILDIATRHFFVETLETRNRPWQWSLAHCRLGDAAMRRTGAT